MCLHPLPFSGVAPELCPSLLLPAWQPQRRWIHTTGAREVGLITPPAAVSSSLSPSGRQLLARPPSPPPRSEADPWQPESASAKPMLISGLQVPCAGIPDRAQTDKRQQRPSPPGQLRRWAGSGQEEHQGHGAFQGLCPTLHTDSQAGHAWHTLCPPR